MTAPEITYATDDELAADREFIRKRDRTEKAEFGATPSGSIDYWVPVTIYEVLEEMHDQFPRTTAVDRVLDLIERLWADPNIHRVDSGDGEGIEFAWMHESNKDR